MKKLFLVFLFAIPLWAQSVTIQNPSFDANVGLTPSNNYAYGIPSWNTTNASAGEYLPPSSAYTSVPGGNQCAFVIQGAITQDLSVGAQPSGTYALSFSVGHRLDGYATVAPVQLFIGATSVASVSVNSANIQAGTFQAFTLSYHAGSSPPSGDLIVSLGTTAGVSVQSDFAAISLTFTPDIPHQTTLSWQANGCSGCTWNVYRSLGASWNPTLLANTPNTTYSDQTIVPGQNYAYKVTAVLNGVESDGPLIAITVDTQ